MPYNTQYTLTWEPEEFILPLDFQEDSNLTEEESYSSYTTWYTHEENMRELSLAHPDILFTLHGIGDEYEDYWFKYFKNGKIQLCPGITIYPPFEEEKMT